jgi:myo-inositol-1(or 4)-monophosphatase
MSLSLDYEALCEETRKIATDAGEFIYGWINRISQQSIEIKGSNNFVTTVDKSAEAMIISRLETLVEGAGFIAEEGTNATRGERYNWVIDPLDGTTNFIHSSPPVAVSIALIDGNEPVVAVVYEIWMKEAFYAWKGSAAYLNGKEIKVSETPRLNDSLIALGFPYNDNNQLQRFLRSLEYFFVHTHGVRRLGSAATDLAYVACGRYDGFYEYNLSPWDVAAGALIVERAGGKVTDFDGGNNYLFGKEIIASNRRIHEAFLMDVARFMND